MSKRKTHEEFILELQSLNPNYIIIGQYVNCKTKVKCKCNECSNEWSAIPNNLLKGQGCIVCSNKRSGNKRRKSNEQFLCELSKISDTIIPLEEYKGALVKILVHCNDCGNEWMVEPHSLLSGKGCNICRSKLGGMKQRKTHIQFITEINELHPDLIINTQYIDSWTEVNCTCKRCKNNFDSKPVNLLSNKGCPYCVLPHGEKRISKYLQDNCIDFIQQKKFDGLVGLGGGLLSYDFYLPGYNMLIEYQGEYHDGTARNQTEFDLHKQQEHDKRKRKYAENHRINLLEIWYYEYDNIENILNNCFTQQNELYYKIP
jgi:hypothetical protein